MNRSTDNSIGKPWISSSPGLTRTAFVSAWVRSCKWTSTRLPDWLFLEDSYEEVHLSATKFIDAVVNRYRGKVQLWHVTARLNQDGAFAFAEEQRLRLVVDAVDRVRAVEARTPLVVSFNQPWAEYIARKDQELTPINFADTLIRGELGLAGIGLEIHYGYWPGGTMPRDAMDTSRLLDRWSQIGVPLMVFVSAAPAAWGPMRWPAIGPSTGRSSCRRYLSRVAASSRRAFVPHPASQTLRPSHRLGSLAGQPAA